jgi:branched-chain amino acid transport system ATP-binding protein
MGEGLIIAEGRHSSIVTNPRVIDAYLGKHHSTPLDRAEQDRQLAEAAALIEQEELPDQRGQPEPAGPDGAQAETEEERA